MWTGVTVGIGDAVSQMSRQKPRQSRLSAKIANELCHRNIRLPLSLSGKSRQQRCNKNSKRHHCGDWIPRQSKEVSFGPIAFGGDVTEDNWFAWLHLHSGKEELRPHAGENFFDQDRIFPWRRRQSTATKALRPNPTGYLRRARPAHPVRDAGAARFPPACCTRAASAWLFES